MGIGQILGGALVQFGIERAGDAAINSAKARRKRALVRRDEWVERYVGKLMRRTADLERRTRTLKADRERVDGNLEDPDFWTTFEKAAEAAARSGNDEKHELLARLVVERLASAADSTRALASARAVEVVPHLAPQHLVLLGLAALVYDVRPSISMPELRPHDQIDDHREENRRIQQEMSTENERFVEWLRRSLAKVPVPEEPPTDVDSAHLVSVAVLILDERTQRDLIETLSPWRDAEPRLFTSMLAKRPLVEFMGTDLGGRLRDLWSTWLQHVTLTPAGLVIGSSVVQFRTGSETTIDLDSSTYVSAGKLPPNSIWDGRRVESSFMEALEREVESRAERGAGIWRAILRR